MYRKKKNITGLIIIGIVLYSILTPIIFTLDNPEQEIIDNDSNPNEKINDEEPQPINDDDDPDPQEPQPINDDDDPDPQEPQPINDDGEPIKDDDEPIKDDDEPIKDDDGPIKDDDGPGKDDDGPIKDDDGPGKDDDDPNPKDQIISATIDFCPKTLNLKSKGKWVTVYIELQEGYNVNDIDIDTISLNISLGKLSRAESSPTKIGDYDEDEFPDLMVKFDRQDVIVIFELYENEEIVITGKLYDDTEFEGTCIIRVINQIKHYEIPYGYISTAS